MDPDVCDWSTVTMASEHVFLEVNPARCAVTGNYVMKNPSDSTIEEVAYPYDSRFPNDLDKFRAWVDGKQVFVKSGKLDESIREKLRLKYEADMKALHAPIAYASAANLNLYKCWKVAFPKGKRRLIRVSYVTIPRTENDATYAWDTPATPIDRNGNISQTDAALIALANGEEIVATYVLFTGGRWEGKIKRAVIDADIDATSSWKIKIEPQPSSVQGTKHRWVFRNFEPHSYSSNGAIKIRFQPRKLSKSIKANIYKSVAQRHLHESQLCKEIAEKLGALGYKKEAAQICMQSSKRHQKAPESKGL